MARVRPHDPPKLLLDQPSPAFNRAFFGAGEVRSAEVAVEPSALLPERLLLGVFLREGR
jgi:hypothetical protein